MASTTRSTVAVARVREAGVKGRTPAAARQATFFTASWHFACLLLASRVQAGYINQDDPNFHEPTECFNPVENYATSPQCTQGIDYWSGQAEHLESLLEEEEPGVHCTMNEVTHKIQCATNSSCWGGGVYDHEINETSYTYNCAARCGASESMLESCCGICLHEKHGSGTNQRHIHCLGCDRFHNVESRRLGQRRLGPCSVSDNGTFFCNRGDGCQAGQPEESDESWNCKILPCNHCSDRHLKAECCKECFTTKCQGTQRTACVGCEWEGMPPAPAITTAAREAPVIAAAATGGGGDVGGGGGGLGLGGFSPNLDWTVLLTIMTCIGICASLAILAFLAMRQSECITDSSSSEDEKLVPVAVTIMPPQANSGYAVQQTNWQQWEPASLQQRPPGAVPGAMPTTILG